MDDDDVIGGGGVGACVGLSTQNDVLKGGKTVRCPKALQDASTQRFAPD